MRPVGYTPVMSEAPHVLSPFGGRGPAPTGNFWMLIILVLGLLVAAVGFLPDRAPELLTAGPLVPEETERPSRVYTVTYNFGVFSPTNLRIRVGDTVTFRNESAHNVRIRAVVSEGSSVPVFDSVGPVPSGSGFAFTFTEEGVFDYSNADNKRESGVIIVRHP